MLGGSEQYSEEETYSGRGAVADTVPDIHREILSQLKLARFSRMLKTLA